MRRRSRAALFALVGACVTSPPAFAERADRDKPVTIESDRMTADESKRTAVFEGRVVLNQGTLTIRADRLVVRQDSEGFQHGVATGRPASFRQKRDGSDEYIHGEGERIEYDGRNERIQFFGQAHLRRDSGDDVRGNYISYDARTGFFTVQSARDPSGTGQDNRVRAVIMPKKAASEGGAADARPDAGRGTQ